MRIDKFLWCVRRFKTRSLATAAVGREQVTLNERVVKSSAVVKVGAVLALREPPIMRSWEVLAIPASRVGPKLVGNFIVERTSFADLDRLEVARLARLQQRDPGEGRPTKKDRRDMDRFNRD